MLTALINRLNYINKFKFPTDEALGKHMFKRTFSVRLHQKYIQS